MAGLPWQNSPAVLEAAVVCGDPQLASGVQDSPLHIFWC